MASIALDLEVSNQSIHAWHKQHLVDTGRMPGISSTESAALKVAHKRIAELETELAAERRASIGFDTTAELLIAAGDNADRVRSEAALAKLCGVCPIPAGSGKTNGRDRLNRGGNRQANAALYRVVIVRMRWHPLTIAYVERRTKEGLSKKDIIRCLKRYVVREIYQLIPNISGDVASHVVSEAA